MSRHDIDVYLDGQPIRFTYKRSSGSLTCQTGKLAKGTHTVEIEAYVETDEGEQNAVGRKKWTFNVKN